MPLDWNKPLATRDGRKVRVVCNNKLSTLNRYPILALVTTEEGGMEIPISYTADGKFYYASESHHGADLFNVPERFEGTRWLNIYSDGSVNMYNSRETADNGSDEDRVACVPVHFNVQRGQGL